MAPRRAGSDGAGVIEIGKTYKDGWGAEHRVAGLVASNPEWVWTIGGFWFRKSDGRKIAYTLVDSSKPDGIRRHAPASRATHWDLVIPKEPAAQGS